MKKAIDQNLLNTLKKTTIYVVMASLFIAFFVPILFSMTIVRNDKSQIETQIKKTENVLDNNKKNLLENSENKIFNDYLNGNTSNFWDVNRILYSQKTESHIDYRFFVMSKNYEILISSESMIIDAYSDKYFSFMTSFNESSLDNEVVIKKVTSSIPNEEDLLMMYKTIKEDQNIIGYIIFLFDSSSFSFLSSEESYYIFSDKFSNVIFTDVPELIKPSGTFIHVLSEKDQLKLAKYHHIETNFSKYPYKIHRYYSVQDMLRSTYIAILLVVFFSILFLIVRSLYYNRLIKDNISFALQIRTAVLAFAKGDLTYRIQYKKEELSPTHYFVDKYNEILDLLESTMNNSITMSELVSDAERRLLHSQFNPHFIFNVLETIKYSLPNNAEDSHEMIESLAKIMRYSVYVTEDIVSLQEDIQYIQEYLKLQKVRYEERLNFNLEVDERALLKKIPKLIIQPLVENSIKHGFRADKTLNIDINIILSNDNTIITIKDDGMGIQEKHLNQIQQRIHLVKQGENVVVNDNIGLINTAKRLRCAFDDNYIFMIESYDNKGTNIMIVIKGEIND